MLLTWRHEQGSQNEFCPLGHSATKRKVPQVPLSLAATRLDPVQLTKPAENSPGSKETAFPSPLTSQGGVREAAKPSLSRSGMMLTAQHHLWAHRWIKTSLLFPQASKSFRFTPGGRRGSRRRFSMRATLLRCCPGQVLLPTTIRWDYCRGFCLLIQEPSRPESSGASVLTRNSAAFVTVHKHIWKVTLLIREKFNFYFKIRWAILIRE